MIQRSRTALLIGVSQHLVRDSSLHFADHRGRLLDLDGQR